MLPLGIAHQHPSTVSCTHTRTQHTASCVWCPSPSPDLCVQSCAVSQGSLFTFRYVAKSNTCIALQPYVCTRLVHRVHGSGNSDDQSAPTGPEPVTDLWRRWEMASGNGHVTKALGLISDRFTVTAMVSFSTVVAWPGLGGPCFKGFVLFS